MGDDLVIWMGIPESYRYLRCAMRISIMSGPRCVGVAREAQPRGHARAIAWQALKTCIENMKVIH